MEACAEALTAIPDDFLTLPVERQNAVLIALSATDVAAFQTCKAKHARLKERVLKDREQ